jgi:hypothetical protein
MIKCPCCSDTLLRHIRSGQTYLLCRSCRLEILDEHHRQVTRPQATAKPIEKATSSLQNRKEWITPLLP